MKLLKIILVIVLILQLFSCSNKDENKKIEISENIIKKLEKIKSYKELFTKVSSKKLENPDNKFLYFSDIQENENYIVGKSSSPEGIHYWNKQGKYIGKIGEKGKGPGEYYGTYTILLIKNKFLIINSYLGRVTEFKLTLKNPIFVETYNLEKLGLKTNEISYISLAYHKNNKIYLCNLTPQPNKYKVFVLNNELQLIKKIKKSKKESWIVDTNCIYINRNRIYILDDIWHKNLKNAMNGKFNFSGKIFIHNLDGKLLRKVEIESIDIFSGKKNNFFVDKSNKLFLINNYIVTANGKIIKKISMNINRNKDIEESFISIERNYLYKTEEKIRRFRKTRKRPKIVDDKYLILNKYEFDMENL